jgi:hypothetical protein
MAAMETSSSDAARLNDERERLAYSLWEDRGRPLGSPEVDWSCADQILRAHALGPRALVGGIAEISNGAPLAPGWSYFVAPAIAIPEFCKRAARLLSNGLRNFHHSSFNDSNAAAFEQFLRLIRETLDQHERSLVQVVSNGSPWMNELSANSSRVVAGSFAAAGVTDRGIIAVAQKCAPPIFAIQRMLQPTNDHVDLRLEIAENSTTVPFASLQLLMRLRTVKAARILAAAFNSHGSSESPMLNRDGGGIAILPGEQSWLVQASDVVGNFASMSASPDRGRRIEIFHAVFGDVLPENRATGFRYPHAK